MTIYQYVVTLPMVVILHYFSPDPALTRLPTPVGATETHDIAYADGPRHRLDVYAPKPGGGAAPVVVFFYGGGWTSGEKWQYRFVGNALVSSGMLVVIPDYRLYPQSLFPAFMDDAAEAVAWIRANAAEFGGDPRRIFLMGHSAGAHIATLLALDPSYLQSVGMTTEDLCGVIGLAGPYDFLPLATPNMQAIFGQVPDLSRTQPINFANHRGAPMLLAAGTWDTAVNPVNTTNLASKMRSAGTSVTVGIYPEITHHALIESITPQLSFISPVRKDTLDFIAAHPCGNTKVTAGR